jgi:hypothetical protein
MDARCGVNANWRLELSYTLRKLSCFLVGRILEDDGISSYGRVVPCVSAPRAAKPDAHGLSQFA